ncbi:hypothetical protein MHYP_G00013640 [Metynnis hypsauchen]
MAFAIYYFKDETVEVGETDWMSAEDQQHTSSEMTTQRPRLEDEDGWINVKWDKGRKRKHGPAFFPAKVLMISAFSQTTTVTVPEEGGIHKGCRQLEPNTQAKQ